jgi:hypothetical protein
MTAPTDQLAFLTRTIPSAAAKFLADAGAVIARRADRILDDLEAQGASIASSLTHQATNLAERMTARLNFASRDDLAALRARLLEVEQRLDRTETHPRSPETADRDGVPPPLPPSHAD